MGEMMKRKKTLAGLGLAAAALMALGVAAPAQAATAGYSSQVCASALRPAIYGASVGTLALTIYSPGGNRTDSWYNSNRTTRVKRTNVGENFSNGGQASYSGSLTDKGQDCRLV